MTNTKYQNSSTEKNIDHLCAGLLAKGTFFEREFSVNQIGFVFKERLSFSNSRFSRNVCVQHTTCLICFWSAYVLTFVK